MKRRSLRARAEREARVADEALLVERLTQLGMPHPVTVHENRTVLVSFTDRGGLWIHRGYAYVSDRTLKAVLASVGSGRRPLMKQAELEVVSFPVEEYVTPRPRRMRRPRLRPGDRRLLADLAEMHGRLNEMHFDGRLAPVGFRISDRMRTRLGEVIIRSETDPVVEIRISRQHLLHDQWNEVRDTVLHEMIHQWQAESGVELDHGPAFRKKAKEIGVLPRSHGSL
ncbi:MAG: SprT-like domain-containing protein [Gemmatimonadota bacterium]|nr:MAG: SprT-like domain-containing protein [Gemmatimonadota bacterium]